MNNETLTPPQIDLSALTADELQAELKRRQSAEQERQIKDKKEYEADNESFITHTVNKAKTLHNEMKEFKEYTIREANKLYVRMYELEGKEPKEVKTFSRISADGNMKVTVDMQERFVFTDEAEVHLNTIQEIFKNKFQDRNKGFYKFFERVMMRNSKGEFDPKLLYKAKAEARNLGEDSIIEALNKLDECQRVVGTSLYCRFYARDEKQKWQDVSLQFSSL